MITARSFTADFLASLAHQGEDAAVLAAVFNVTPAEVVKTSTAVDLQGIDYLVNTPSGTVGVDMKRRSRAYGPAGDHDWLIEIKSGNRPGPLFRSGPLPDFYATIVQATPLSWAYVIPALPLRDAARANVTRWRAIYGEHQSLTAKDNGGYVVTTFTAVPFHRLVKAINEL
jgi:hypothetical protein